MVAVRADLREQVKPRGGGRRQNHVPPEAAHALEQARKAQESIVK